MSFVVPINEGNGTHEVFSLLELRNDGLGLSVHSRGNELIVNPRSGTSHNEVESWLQDLQDTGKIGGFKKVQ